MRVIIMTSLSKRAWLRTLTRDLPRKAPTTTAGAKRAAVPRFDGVIIPSPMEKGSLARLTREKNQAAVPRKALTSNREARKYKPIMGPPALATVVVKPARKP